MQIILKTRTGQSYHLIVESTDSIKTVHAKIFIQRPELPHVERFTLFHGGKPLNSFISTLADYGVEDGATLDLDLVVQEYVYKTHADAAPDGTMQIFLRDLPGKIFSVWVNPTDTMREVQAKIYLQHSEFPLPGQYRLIFAGKELNLNDTTGRTLADYNVQKEATLHMIVRLYGGATAFNGSSASNASPPPRVPPALLKQTPPALTRFLQQNKVPSLSGPGISPSLGRAKFLLRPPPMSETPLDIFDSLTGEPRPIVPVALPRAPKSSENGPTDYEERDLEIQRQQAAIEELCATSLRLDAELVTATSQQPAANDAYEAAKAIHQENLTNLDDLRNRLELALGESERACNERCSDLMQAFARAEESLALQRTVRPPPYIAQPARTAPQREWNAFRTAMQNRNDQIARNTQEFNRLQEVVMVAEASLRNFKEQPVRDIRAQILQCEARVAASRTTLATSLEAKNHASVLRVQIQNVGTWKARAEDALSHAIHDGFAVLTFVKVPNANKEPVLESQEPVLKTQEPVLEAIVQCDPQMPFADMIRWRNGLPSAGPADPIPGRLFPNSRRFTPEERSRWNSMSSDLYVSNLPEDTTHAQLCGLFRGYGDCKIKLPTDHYTGKPRTFAFVNFSRILDADNAQKNLNGLRFNSHVLRVEFKTEKPVRCGGGGGCKFSFAFDEGDKEDDEAEQE
jgi:hypothetical protein